MLFWGFFGLVFFLLSTKPCYLFPQWQAEVLAMAISARSGAVLQDNVAELEMERAAGRQTESVFIPSSYKAKELF